MSAVSVTLLLNQEIEYYAVFSPYFHIIPYTLSKSSAFVVSVMLFGVKQDNLGQIRQDRGLPYLNAHRVNSNSHILEFLYSFVSLHYYLYINTFCRKAYFKIIRRL